MITAGPSREAIDPVRYISNYSSGKMGYALAEAAHSLGADTVLISGPTGLTPPPGVRFVSFESTAQLHQAAGAEFGSADCLIMAAAPADFCPSEVAAEKIKRGPDGLTIDLDPSPDILADLGTRKREGQLLVGFALETDRPLENARRKLKAKRLDLIVLNQVGETTGFDRDTNQVTIIAPGRKPETWPLQKKNEIAVRLLVKLAAML